MSLTNIITNGSCIQFKTKNITDPNTYRGVVKGILDYDIAKVYFDLDGYYSNVVNEVGLKNIPPKESLTYFILVMENGELTYHAIEWIDEATFTVIEKRGKLTLDVLDVNDSEIDAIISKLNEYTVVIKKFDEEVKYE